MIVFSCGIPKSGSTLAFQIARAVAVLGGHPQWRLPPPLVSPGHRVNFQQVLDAGLLRQVAERIGGRTLVIKTHDSPGLEWIAAYRDLAERGQAKALVSHRDPRDICLALLDAGRRARRRGEEAFSEFATLDGAAARVGGYLAEMERWSDLPGLLHLRYETCAFRMDEAITAVAEHLGLRCPHWPVRFYVERIAFTHRNKALPERHRTELTAEQRAPLDAAFAGYLDAMGYARHVPDAPPC
ncbi:hypothetical protein GXW74_07540 [Roseomonas eburnea]|uniref:Sulfotransferase n=1 Tax=Neoroseomonas eburnea TaxID=1346889 RepID=A0A9X9X9E9_9PROT|nr:hypothetical protein [Neoroseomonas eburnea]MBR0680335.1 hypothetical protein [Neoroseomonas eburnea]